jgi:hypothetical protein
MAEMEQLRSSFGFFERFGDELSTSCDEPDGDVAPRRGATPIAESIDDGGPPHYDDIYC